jgi:hypothetical protein
VHITRDCTGSSDESEEEAALRAADEAGVAVKIKKSSSKNSKNN